MTGKGVLETLENIGRLRYIRRTKKTQGVLEILENIGRLRDLRRTKKTQGVLRDLEQLGRLRDLRRTRSPINFFVKPDSVKRTGLFYFTNFLVILLILWPLLFFLRLSPSPKSQQFQKVRPKLLCQSRQP